MNAEKLSKAIGYIDDDLIAECDKVRIPSEEKTVKTPVKRKASVMPLISKIAVAAAVLVIGGLLLSVLMQSQKSSESASETLKYQARDIDSYVGANDINADDRAVDGGYEDEIREDVPAEETENNSLLGPEGTAMDSISLATEGSEDDYVILNGEEYLLLFDEDDSSKIGDYIGDVEESSDEELIGARAYVYNADDEDDVLIAVEYHDSFKVFKLQ